VVLSSRLYTVCARPQVLEAAWPVLSAIAEHPVCRSEASVVAALSEVFQVGPGGRGAAALVQFINHINSWIEGSTYIHTAFQSQPLPVHTPCLPACLQRALMSAKASGRALLPTLLAAVGAIFAAAPHPGCFDVLGGWIVS
jgi:hypothetical protein